VHYYFIITPKALQVNNLKEISALPDCGKIVEKGIAGLGLFDVSPRVFLQGERCCGKFPGFLQDLST